MGFKALISNVLCHSMLHRSNPEFSAKMKTALGSWENFLQNQVPENKKNINSYHEKFYEKHEKK